MITFKIHVSFLNESAFLNEKFEAEFGITLNSTTIYVTYIWEKWQCYKQNAINNILFELTLSLSNVK